MENEIRISQIMDELRQMRTPLQEVGMSSFSELNEEEMLELDETRGREVVLFDHGTNRRD